MNQPVRGLIALATSADYPALTSDDRALRDALAGAGYEPAVRRWDDTAADWAGYRAIIIRSCWDYHRRIAEFQGWLDRLERAGMQVFNSVPVLRWNARKTYLKDLSARGVAVVPTAWVPRGTRAALSAIGAEQGWGRMVVKPVVSASAFHTWRTGTEITDEDESAFRSMVAERDLMVQPFQPEIETAGELSLIFFGTRFSHAVRKRPRPGDFRVQAEFGGTAEPVAVGEDIIGQAAAAVRCAPEPTLYARVDGCELGGTFRVMELELIEPWLFFLEEPRAAGRCVEALGGGSVLSSAI